MLSQVNLLRLLLQPVKVFLVVLLWQKTNRLKGRQNLYSSLLDLIHILLILGVLHPPTSVLGNFV